MNTTQIYVNHIPPSYGIDEIKQLFSTYGNITDVNYPVDRKTDRPKGYAFLTFESAESAQRATEKNNQAIDGITLIVEPAKVKPAKQRTTEIYKRK